MKNKRLILVVNLLVLLSMILTACAATASNTSNFPTGKFMLVGNDFVGIQFNDDGTWYGLNYGQHDPTGTYSVRGDLFIEESNNYDCGESPMSFRYTFDGANLKFELTEESMGDICEGRKAAYDGTTYVLTR